MLSERLTQRDWARFNDKPTTKMSTEIPIPVTVLVVCTSKIVQIIDGSNQSINGSIFAFCGGIEAQDSYPKW